MQQPVEDLAQLLAPHLSSSSYLLTVCHLHDWRKPPSSTIYDVCRGDSMAMQCCPDTKYPRSLYGAAKTQTQATQYPNPDGIVSLSFDTHAMHKEVVHIHRRMTKSLFTSTAK